MPIISENIPAPMDEPEAIEPGWGQTFIDATMMNTTIGTAVKAMAKPEFGYDADYEPMDNLGEHIMYGRELSDVTSAEEMTYRKWQIDEDHRMNQRLSESGGKGITAMVATGMLDPVYMALALTPLGMTKQVGTLAKAAEFAAAGGIGETVAESILHTNQDIRTIEESLINIGGTTLLSGALGGLASRFARDEIDLVAKGIEEEVAEVSKSTSVGAMRAGMSDREQEIINLTGVKDVIKKVHPGMRLADSESLAARNISENLIENPFLTAKNLEEGGATAQSVETAIKRWDAGVSKSIQDLNDLYVRYRTGQAGAGGLTGRTKVWVGDLTGRRKASGQLTFGEFATEVGKQIRRDTPHSVTEIDEAAQAFRANVYDPALKLAQDIGYFPKEMNLIGSAKYLNRIYNKQMIRGNRAEFERIMTRWLTTKEDERVFREYQDAINDYAKKPEGRKPELEEIEKDLIETEVDDIISNLLGEGEGFQHPGITPTASALKQRVIDIEDEVLGDFIENDIEIAARAYQSSAIPRLEMQRRFGSIDLKNELAAVREDYKRLRGQIKEDDHKAIARLNKKEEQAIEDIKAMRDRLYNIYGMAANPDSMFNRLSRSWMDVNYIAKLGGMTVSAGVDIARPIMRWGLKPFARTMAQLFSDPKQFRVSMKAQKEMGVGWDMVSNARAKSIADIDDMYLPKTAVERGIHGMASTFGIPSLMAPWNAFWKQFSGVMVSHEILQAATKIAKGEKVSARKMQEFRSLGISDADLKKMGKEFEKHGETDGILMPRGNRWDDQNLNDTFANAVLKEVDNIIVTPGVGDRPLVMSTQLGKMWLQFNSFAFSANSKILASGLQRRDAETMSGLMLTVALGSGVYAFKEWNKGKDVSTDPQKLLAEGIDRSGVLGIVSPGLGALEQATGLGVGRILGDAPMSKYNSRGWAGAALGPSFATLWDFGIVTKAMSDGEMSKSEIHAIRKTLPYQNIFWLRRTLNQLEKAAAE